MSSRLLLTRLTVAAIIALVQGCGGCGGSGTPPEPPPKPVKGNIPPTQAAPPPAAMAPDEEIKDACALLVFANVEEGPAPLVTQLTAEGDMRLTERGMVEIDGPVDHRNPNSGITARRFLPQLLQY